MNQTQQACFDRFRAALEQKPYTLPDLLDIIGGFFETSPVVGIALIKHASDILADQPLLSDYRGVIAEVYRRGFFDPTAAALYGTENLATTDGMLVKFTDYLVASLEMDATQMNKGSYVGTNTDRH